ncbi:non-ribosomal peptide synthetase [Bacillus subtilis]|uniref:non-ribosomal peptide synthetase n=1 Tax=Bacillus subtilis TaxID=1423 RepID=UPI0005ADDA22|nr:non-ribosomal peptide synthetase [Bacillus subtilis]KIN38143.1 Long-chain-fatty-acid--CoA ligase [Bacillus subtilis]
MGGTKVIKSYRKIIANQQVKEGAYWREKLAGHRKIACFPYDSYQSKSQESISTSNYQFSEDLLEQVKKISNNNDHALHVVFATAVTVLLYKYTGMEDIIIGQPVLNSVSEDTVSDRLILRSRLEADATFKSLLIQMKETVLGAIEHENYPIDVLAEELELKMNSGENSFYAIGVQLENIHASTFNEECPKILFSFKKEERGISLSIKYNTLYFQLETIDRIASHYFKVLEQVLNNLEIKLLDIDLLTSSDSKWITNYNKTQFDFGSSLKFIDVFETQVAQRPTARAIVGDGKSLTYQEFNARVNRLARTLRDRGVQPDSFVAIMAERSIEMIVGIFAILKAGGAYIPIDPKYPQARVKYLLEDSHSEVVLMQEKFMDRLDDDYQKLNLDDEASYAKDESNLASVNRANDLAYVIYTSGSTGKPKGVMIEHRNLMHILTSLEERYPFGAEDAYLLKTPFAFDVSVSELFGWVRGGGHLVILEPEAEKDPEKLLEVLRESNVTHVNFVPSLLNVFVQLLKDCNDRSLPALKYVFVAGEVLPKKVAYNFKEMFHDVCLENLYGPTEITIYATNYSMGDDTKLGSIPIGKPLPNVQAYIVNEQLSLQPVGIAGELCIAGSGVARGYLNRHDLSEEKFVTCPWEPGVKMYRTGDLVRWLANGDIEYLGRIDHQVKIRGFRIELEEVERVILEHPSVREALAVVYEDKKGDKNLVTYVVLEVGKEMCSNEVKGYLQELLPEYMVPTAYVFLEAFPLNHNGKVDRKALPEPKMTGAQEALYIAPRTVLEKKIADIWMSVLHVEKIGIYDNFFECGGHSLLATQLLSRLRSTFDTEISLRELFDNPTIAGLVSKVTFSDREEKNELELGLKHNNEKILPVSREGKIPLSFTQKRLWFLNRLEPESIAYNIFSVLRVDGELDKQALEICINQLVERHEALRTTFKDEDGPVQIISPTLHIPLSLIDFREIAEIEKETEVERFILEETRRPFDLERGPLLHVSLLWLNETEYVLLVSMHHIISDGWSMGLLIQELGELYSAHLHGKSANLPELTVQYADYAEWQNNKVSGENFERLTTYWTEKLGGELPILELPSDNPRPERQTFLGGRKIVQIQNDAVQKLKELSHREEVTLFMVFLSAFSVLLSRLSRQEDLIVGTPIAGRTHTETEPLIGCFVNTLALRIDLSEKPTFVDLLKRVRRVCLDAYAHQEMSFEKLVEIIKPERSLSRNPIFDVMINLVNTPNENAQWQGVNYLAP